MQDTTKAQMLSEAHCDQNQNCLQLQSASPGPPKLLKRVPITPPPHQLRWTRLENGISFSSFLVLIVTG